MLKECLNGYTVVKYKWVVLAKLIVIFLVCISGYVLANTVMEWEKPADASSVAGTAGFKSAGKTERVKPAVVEWMRHKSEMPDQVLSSIYDAAEKNLNTELILAICMVESNFNPGLKSSKGAIGLMGIMPAVWLEELKANGIVTEKRDLFLIPNNIASGIYVLEKYLATAGNLEKALFAYVGGDSEYVRKILQALGEIYHVKMVKAPGGRPVAAAGVAGKYPAGVNSG
jgi:soluble lytic murein transglycosylase-like protein